jgi:hypothetical protein
MSQQHDYGDCPNRMSEAEESLKRAEELLARLDEVREQLEATEDPDAAIDLLSELSRIAKEVDSELNRAKRAADADA